MINVLFGRRDTAVKADNYLLIHYVYQGLDYQLYVPYRRQLAIQQLTKDWVIIDGSTERRLYQPPGVPLLVDATDLKVDQLVFRDID